MDVVVVESPNKVKSINKYLGKNYKVLASFGHVRDLPAKDGSVKPDDDFAMSWAVDTASAKRLSELAKAVKEADGLILATDPDREGEAIAWHVLEVLKQKKVLKDKPIKRVAFNSITKQAVLDAIANPREIDPPLVDAYLARRALDYLVGFTLSPVLWRKLPGARSAGRVQSVALRFVCDREAEIERFVREEYWQIAAILGTPRNENFEARLTAFDGKKLQKLDISSQAMADDIKTMLEGASFRALSVEAKPTKRNPGPPFTTSTLQQAASSRLSFSAQRTMQVAQRLYEGMDIGYISAVGAGAISFLSPCVLPLVPPYLCYMAGVSVDDFRGNAGIAAKAGARGALLIASIAFVLGFSTVFVALGAGASTIGRLLRVYQEPLAMIAGALIILMGLNFLGIVRIPLLSREARFQSQGKPASAVAAYVMGLAFAFGWTPCIGPVLGPILTLAGGRETMSEGALLLAAYSLGLGIPFFIAALFSGAFMRFLGKFRLHLGRVEKAIGALLVVAGVFFLTGGVQVMAYWLLENFPALGRLG